MASAFFYGTLMSDDVLLRVLCGPYATPDIKQQKKDALQLRPASLIGHQRFALKGLPFPGIIRTKSEDQVRGILCEGLNANDVMRLDEFEGPEYDRSTAAAMVDGQRVPCQVYLWIGGEQHLESHDWELEGFVKGALVDWLKDRSEFNMSDTLDI
ncbi:hypothetical protein J3Q64DRAFT_1716661 [Phycomyces blakesleeanus]|uniref:Putative gamma-glutamylcyclotransferase n=2 Tax=Phycomyces blakesleeanus TaxID=4837 RepID=A0A167QMY8_PHYB8|nr:hypothetical protein PHYBLDRAFT_157395 [Phycomyces blakesleeanus NRRL 1555(-)]OAD79951.1 hypothetical protein PHYBLDRAFT_157395 [Phycomyces blakesleeanus NRRL 1555(-)]|eukprot:XP_018297991.1 hypothetical protein PHYBLDRAFT_157395 [Phycomyces blakesleeanus NRRL 1555(-)]